MEQKQGANGIVTFKGNIAIKTLSSRNRERVSRFSIEVEALRRARDAGIPNVVELLDAQLDQVPPRFSMRKCVGDIDEILLQTRNNPTMVARIFLPVVRSLERLASLSAPIYHRDLKPSNILYERTVDDPNLVISDFGCAFLADPELERMTMQTRAVGATFFRAPEYTHGRVEEVTAAGDIFSIGKLLWYMCNGVPGEVFPYTLWFPDEYNLAFRCDASSIGSLNLIVASCVAHEPSERISYVSLIAALQNLLDNPMPDFNETERLRILAYEAELKVQQETAIATFSQLLYMLQTDLTWLADQLSEIYEGTLLANSVHSLAKFNIAIDFLAKTLIVDESDMPVCDWNTTHARFHIRANPGSTAIYHALPALSLPYIEIRSTMSSGTDRLIIFHSSDQGIMIKGEPASAIVPYSKTVILAFFRRMFSKIGR